MDKKTLYALLAMLALFLVFDQFIWRPQARQKAALEQTRRAPDQNTRAEAYPSPAPVATDPQSTGTVDSLFSTGDSEQLVSLQNELVRVDLSSKGAVISQVELLKFFKNSGQPVRLVNPESSIAGTSIYSDAYTRITDGLIFHVSQTEDKSRVRFYLGEEDKPLIQKTYSLDEQYGILLDIKVMDYPNVKGLELDFGSGIADSEDYLRSKAQDYKFMLYTTQLEKVAVNKLRKSPPSGAITGFNWSAIRSKYFTIAVMEHDPKLMRHYAAFISSTNESPAFKLSSVQPQARNDWQQSFVIYAGPADYDILKSYGTSMENIAERGSSWLRWLANAFAWLLKFLHSLIPNYGLVIIIFSIIMKVLLHPFTHKQMDASIKMMRIQPQVQEIQAKFKNDPRQMQQELSKLYKENGASPFSGCLPLLIQMPIFISLYNVLRYSLDMRNAGFVFWLKDLSEPDKYMILPILMGVFMIIQSRMMRPPVQDAANMDEKQKAMQQSQKMMTWMMPIMMFFIFRSMPAGLVLYWTTFNILSVVQQYYLQKHFREKDSK